MGKSCGLHDMHKLFQHKNKQGNKNALTTIRKEQNENRKTLQRMTYRQDFILRAPDLFPIHALSISNIWSQFLSYSYKRCLGWHVFVCLRCIVGYHLGSLHFSVCDFQKYMRDLSIKQCRILKWVHCRYIFWD